MERVVLFLVFIFSLAVGKGQMKEIPAEVKDEIERVYERMVDYIGEDEVVVFPILTDLHLTSSGAYNHIDYAVYADRLMNFDCIVNLGDIGLGVGVNNREQAAGLMRDVYERHNQYSGTTLFVMGNHDLNDGHDYRVNPREWTSRFLVPQARKSGGKLTYQKTYGYYDIERAKTRLIFLNTSDGDNTENSANYYNLSEKQLNWLVSSLVFKEPGWSVAILSHYCLDSIGFWKGFPEKMGHREELRGIMEAFAAKEKGSVGNVAWNFKSNASHYLVANFCGDSHFDNTVQKNNVRYVITQGYGGVGRQDVPEGGKKWDRGGSMLIDVVVIKPVKQEFKMFRMGAGEDRVFKK